jgi:protein TonB
MTQPAPPPRGPLWARVAEDDGDTLALWKAALVAVALELLVPLLVFGVDWSFLPSWDETPTPVMSVRLDEPPPPPLPPPPDKPKKPEKPIKQVPVELPKPLPDEAPPKIALEKPEEKKPEPKREPEPEPPPEEEPPEPEPEAPPLPSVFRDIKPVKKVVPPYPREAEDAHIQGRVKVRMSVDLDGNVTNVEVLLAEPPGVFDEVVVTAARQFKFKKDGTAYQADEEFVFKIDE